jgi:hypothetical protein
VPTFFRSAARGLHVPAALTREPAKHEARKRRASERPRVGCCGEFGGPFPADVRHRAANSECGTKTLGELLLFHSRMSSATRGLYLSTGAMPQRDRVIASIDLRAGTDDLPVPRRS